MSKKNLSVKLGSLTLPNPILTASGTFGYAKEAAGLYDLSRLGGIIPKTITLSPRNGNRPPRTVEVTAGLLNAIGLDNDGIDEFLAKKLPWLRGVGAPIIVSFAAKKVEECGLFAEKFAAAEGIAALEMNVSCPNVSGGVDFGTNPVLCERIVSRMKKCCTLPLCVKLSPNVTSIADVAMAAEAGGADMISAINTLYGLAVDWRRRVPAAAVCLRMPTFCGIHSMRANDETVPPRSSHTRSIWSMNFRRRKPANASRRRSSASGGSAVTLSALAPVSVRILRSSTMSGSG